MIPIPNYFVLLPPSSSLERRGPRVQRSRSAFPHPRFSSLPLQMADSPRRRSRSPSPHKGRSKSRSRSRTRSPSQSMARPRSQSRSRSRSRSRSGGRGRKEVENVGNTLYVTGLSSRVTERELESHFSKEGKVAGCHLVVEPRTRISRGFAFVTMDTVEDADRCIKYLDRSVLEGRYITVEKSRRKRPRTPTPGHYLGAKSTRETTGRRYDRGRYRGGYGREDDYYGGGGGGGGGGGYRRSPRRSPYHRGGRDYYSPQHSPYGGRSRRERSRSLPHSPYGSSERGYGYRQNLYAR